MLSATRERMRRLGRPVRLLMISEVLTVFSLLVGHLAVSWWVAEQGGAAHLAIYGVVMSATAFVSMPLLSPLADRYPKRTLLGAGLSVFVLETLLLASMVQWLDYALLPLVLLEMVAVMALAVMQPAAMSIAAELVPHEQLAEAFALQKSAQALGRMLGPALCGLILATAGVLAALWLHVALFVVAAWAAFRIPTGSHRAPSEARHWARELTAGLRAKWVIPVERYWTILSFFTMLFFGPAIGLLVPLRVQSLGWSAAWLGWCEAALSAGMLIGALYAARADRAFRSLSDRDYCPGRRGCCPGVGRHSRCALCLAAVLLLHRPVPRLHAADRPDPPHAGGARPVPWPLQRLQSDGHAYGRHARSSPGRHPAAAGRGRSRLSDLRPWHAALRALLPVLAWLSRLPLARPCHGQGLVCTRISAGFCG